MSSRWTRRSLLAGAAAGLASPLLVPRARRARGGPPRFTDDPFKLGVASGSPTPTGFVLWTRLAPEPLRGGGMPDERVEVRFEVAKDDGFRQIVTSGPFNALPELAHSVHAEVEGLEPARPYFYRFFAGAEVSPVGRTHTLPAPDARPKGLKLGYGSCQHFEHGYYAAHRHLAEEELDLMVFLGDYIYESTWGDDLVRAHSGRGEVTRTLAAYRNRHAQYKTDPDLQRLHGSVPWLVTWDDHEVANDYAGFHSERLEPDFRARRQAAYQAFWEHMPLRMAQRPVGGKMRLYDSVRFGQLADLFVLDGRQYKSPQLCPRPGMGGSSTVDACPGLDDPRRTFLGFEQEKWLATGLASSDARWRVLAQQTLVAPVDRKPGPGTRVWTDGWDGYPAARRRLLEALASAERSFVIGGDIHCSVAADLHREPGDPDSPVVSSELCGTSITSQGPTQDQLDAIRPDNPHIRLARAEHGYATLELTEGSAVATVRGLEDAKAPGSKVRTVGQVAVEANRPGLVDAT